MALWDISTLAADYDFALRTTAAYATQPGRTDDPPTWQAAHAWDMAAAPGFGDAYASAVASGVSRPGQDPAVISDAEINAAVQAIAGAAA